MAIPPFQRPAIDYYLSFDAAFFRKPERAKSAVEYKSFLEEHHEVLTRTLCGEAQVTSEIRDHLERLSGREYLHFNLIRKSHEGLTHYY